MEIQILDCDYIMLNKPIIRIFGKTVNGETICVFYDKFLPYFYLHSLDDSKYPEIMAALKERFNKEIIEFEVVERFLPIGYTEKTTKILKIVEKDPSIIHDAKQLRSLIAIVIAQGITSAS